MNIKLNNWKDIILKGNIIYPIVNVPELPKNSQFFNINCESSLIQWFGEFVKLYGNDGFIKLYETHTDDKNQQYSIMRIYCNKYFE